MITPTFLRHLDQLVPRSFVAPTALTVFTGSQEAPTPLCSINLEAKQGAGGTEARDEGGKCGIEQSSTIQYQSSTIINN